MPAIAQTTVEDAIFAWVQATSGLADSNVIWEDRGPIPSGPYVSMRFGSTREIGLDWSKTEDADPPAPGAEIVQKLTGQRVAKLELACFANGARKEVFDPQATLVTVLASRALPNRAAALRSAGVGFGPIGDVLTISIPDGQLFEPRAVVEIDINLVSVVSETATYIEHVEMEGTFKDARGSSLAVVNVTAP